MTDKTPDPCGSDSSAELGHALDAARLALAEFSQQDDYLLAHGASLLSEHSHEIIHIDTALRIAEATPPATLVQEPVAQSIIKALTHAVEIAEAKRPGTWDDLLQYRVLLNTPPAQRQWVGLTREERLHFLNEILDYGTGFVAPLDSVIWNIETNLRSKNNG
jgi:hypothetical protein